MPIFEYVCESCQHRFEALVYGREKARCPKCEGKKLIPQLSVFAVSTKGASSTASTMPSGPCGTCGDPRGAGACSLGESD
jgi:putative FmdB family regulatory protein